METDLSCMRQSKKRLEINQNKTHYWHQLTNLTSKKLNKNTLTNGIILIPTSIMLLLNKGKSFNQKIMNWTQELGD